MTFLRTLLLALPLFTAVTPALAGTATAIPSTAAQNDKQLWRQVMAEFYGRYDKKEKCWVSKTADHSYCMRPQTLNRIADGSRHLLFLSVSGTTLGEDNSCHACTGTLGFLILSDQGKTLSVVARSEPYIEAGSNGEAPTEDKVSVHRIGKPGSYAWAVDSSWMGQGISVTTKVIYAMIGEQVKEVAQLPAAFDDQGNCDNGTNLMTNEKCSELAFGFTFEAGTADEAYMPILMKGSGTLKGEPFTQTFTARFDKATMTYPMPEGMPEDVNP